MIWKTINGIAKLAEKLLKQLLGDALYWAFFAPANPRPSQAKLANVYVLGCLHDKFLGKMFSPKPPTNRGFFNL